MYVYILIVALRVKYLLFGQSFAIVVLLIGVW
jgi:hypothetical protein